MGSKKTAKKVVQQGKAVKPQVVGSKKTKENGSEGKGGKAPAKPLFEDDDSDASSVLEDSEAPTSSEEDEAGDEAESSELEFESDADSGREELDEGDIIEDKATPQENGGAVEEKQDEETEDDGVSMKFLTSHGEDFNLKSKVVLKKGKKQRESPSDGTTEAIAKNTTGKRPATTQPSSSKDEYEVDSSDEEDLRNTIGNVPIEWYDNYPHLGYDVNGKRVYKPVREDQLDYFLKKMDDPTFWRTVKDRLTGQNVILSDADMDLINRLEKGKNPDPNMDPYPKFEDLYSHEVMKHPLTARPEAKRSFIPSLHEKALVGRMVHLIKSGVYAKCWKPKKEEGPRYYNLWTDDEDISLIRRLRSFIPAPKMKLPGHEESYNPPEEYLFTPEEEAEWRNQDPEDRKLNFIPRKYKSLRQVPGYSEFVQERFERCLDLYLCPRQRKMRMNVNPDDLIPQLPKPKDLHPFPAFCSVIYKGHTGHVRSVSMENIGEFFASGSDDGTVRVWETLTGRCFNTIHFEAPVKWVQWCPNPAIALLAVASGQHVHFVNPGVGDKVVLTNTDVILESLPESEGTSKGSPEWSVVTDEALRKQGHRLKVYHKFDVAQVSWHAKGDYLAVLYGSGSTASLIIHQLSLRRSQNPFSKFNSVISRVIFHPTRPHLFVATQTVVRVYNLVKQELQKKLLTNCRYVSSIAVHPKGDNVIAGSFEARLSWFDMDLSTKPYKSMKYHNSAIRAVTFHRKYPLFASASDDGTVIVAHGMVYSDLLQNPLIVPVKVLRGHERVNDLGVLDCAFHPTQPWLVSAGADATLRLYS